MRDADAWDDRYRSRDLVWGVEPNRIFSEAVAGLAPGRALDLACGEGRNAIWLAERGWRVTAVDFSRVALDRGRRLAAQRGVAVDFADHDVRTWTPPRLAFDLVAVLYLHLPSEDLRRVHARAADAVAPGGTLVIVGHDRQNLERGHGGPQDADRLLVPATVAAEVADLEVVSALTVTREVGDDPPVVALDTVVRAIRPR
ncbi:MAG TPA: class I SAM-dependent methyltransferase [Euzebyales bacterium]|nr:class I SAM-dependent methyltransferase [Euzebyales bacterium]